MEEKDLTTEAHLGGVLEDEFAFSHQIKDKCFYSGKLKVRRLSGTVDVIDLIVPVEYIDADTSYKGRYIEIAGQFRSRNTEDLHLELYILVTQNIVCMGYDDDNIRFRDDNSIILKGYLCKKGIRKRTSTGKFIYNFILAINYSKKRTSYLPCIIWGKEQTSDIMTMMLGTKISAAGRIQSRTYKKTEEGKLVDHITHEICLNGFIREE